MDKAALKKGRQLFEQPITFVLSAPKADFLPPATLPEIAFAGRSNVGKSSLINALTKQTKLARTSNTPGRTQELNYFQIGKALYLVDTPGYGYAKAPKEKVKKWQTFITEYLAHRIPLKRVFLLIDARHAPKKNDLEMMALLDYYAAAYQIVLTKCDKISAKTLENTITSLKKTLKYHPAAFPEIIPTSTMKKTGLDELRAAIAYFSNC